LEHGVSLFWCRITECQIRTDSFGKAPSGNDALRVRWKDRPVDADRRHLPVESNARLEFEQHDVIDVCRSVVLAVQNYPFDLVASLRRLIPANVVCSHDDGQVGQMKLLVVVIEPA